MVVVGSEWLSALKALVERYIQLMMCKSYFTFPFFFFQFLPLSLQICTYPRAHMCMCAYVCIYTYAHMTIPSIYVLHYVCLIKCGERNDSTGSKSRIANHPFFSHQKIVNLYSSQVNSFWFSFKWKQMVTYNSFPIGLRVPPFLVLSGFSCSLEWTLYIFLVHKERQSS